MKKLVDEYQARVIDDSGIVRSRVPSPLLQRMGARPGDHVAFRPHGSTATMRITRTKGKIKAKRKKR
jgi:hypothetical protein